jgi:hypothetical protein
MIKIPRELFERFIDAVCYAASMDKVEVRACLKSGLCGNMVALLESPLGYSLNALPIKDKS